jgi:hypothetical protein
MGINDHSSEEEPSSSDEECVDKTITKFLSKLKTDNDTQSFSQSNSDMNNEGVLIPTFSDTILCYSTIEGCFSRKSFTI